MSLTVSSTRKKPRPGTSQHNGYYCAVHAGGAGLRNDQHKKNLSYDKAAGNYAVAQLDEYKGPANVMYFVNDEGVDIVIAANRETDVVAMYEITEE